MRPVSFCSQRCAVQSLDEVFEGIDKLKESALKLSAQQTQAIRRSKELYEKSDKLGDLAAQTLSKWSRNTGQPKIARPKAHHKRGRQEAGIHRDSSRDGADDDSTDDGKEEFSDSMEWETDAPDGQTGTGGSGNCSGDTFDDLDEF
ncbi:hypothetical protein GGR58DRAFT_493802 [Xylaria digitata]|nr:hypothetical protein GGR58DRAFT_493802 [Xylaria digitata]